MRKVLAVLVATGLAAPAVADLTTPAGGGFTAYNLADAGPAAYGLISDGVVAGGARSVLGDTYSVAPLVQDGVSAFFLQDVDGPGPGTTGRYVATFDGTGENSGANLAYSTGTHNFQVTEAQTDLGGGNYLIQVQYTAVNGSGAAEPWVPAGVIGPNGPFTAWRMDLGTNAAGNPIDRLSPNNDFSILNSGFTAFDSTGAALGTFLLTVDDSNPPSGGLSGVAVVGLGGANIAGFDMATLQMFWEINVVPEPASLALLALGGLLVVRRR